MKEKVYRHLDSLIIRYPILERCRESIANSYRILEQCYLSDGKVLIAGNGGSAADADHIVGELMKGFCKLRCLDANEKSSLRQIDSFLGNVLADKLQKSLPAIAVTNHIALSTAYANDVEGDLIYAQQVYGYGANNDVFCGISTSGNSQNILYAAVAAKAKGMQVLALTGKEGGRLRGIADITICVPEEEVFKIQELHLPVYHCICLMLEERFFSEGQ